MRASFLLAGLLLGIVPAVVHGANHSPNAPRINEPATDNLLLNPADVHMETAPFSDQDTNDVHVCSDFEIWTISPLEVAWFTHCIGGLEKVHTHLGDGVFTNAHVGKHELFFDTNYKLRVRHKDSSGVAATEWSAWTERPFRTTSQQQPVPNAPGWIVYQPGFKIEVVAHGMQLPVNIAFLPNPGNNANSPFFYVTELYGNIKLIRRDGTVTDYATNLLNFGPSGIFPGSGEQGLAGIVVDPVSGDVFAGMLYDPDGLPGEPHYPKVVRFHSVDGGLTAATQTTILNMAGEQQGQSHMISNLSIGPDGKLYVHMGDGFDATRGQDTNSFRGKILRMELDGRPCTNSPFYKASNGTNAQDYIYAYGVRNPFGGDWRSSDGFHYEVENGPSVDRFAKVVPGRNYLYDGSDASMSNFAIYNWSPAVGPVNVAFIQTNRFNGSGFPSNKWDHAFVTESGPTWASGPQSNGKRISEFVLSATGTRISGPTKLIEYNSTYKATVAALAAGPDGLYFSDLYEDQNYTGPSDRGANILRVRWVGTNLPPFVALTNPVDGVSFRLPTNIVLSADASDTNGIAKVEFYAGANKTGQKTNAPYTLTWTNPPAGNYALTARATGKSGLSATSAVVNVVVMQTNVFPTVSISSPTNGSIYLAPAAISIVPLANDTDGNVTNVAFFAGPTKLGDNPSSPFGFTWNAGTGGNYALKAVATDNNGASVTSTVVNIIVAPPPPADPLVLMGAGSLWKYLDDGSNQSTNWTSSAYNDSGWASGLAQLGYGNGDETTVVRSNRADGTRIVTTYFRRSVNVSNAASFGSIYLRLLRDDGAVVYLNGTEILRDNMPTGAVNYATLALTNVAGGAESTNFIPAIVPAQALRSGTNQFAVEVHQVTTNSPDLSFDLEVIGLPLLRLENMARAGNGPANFSVRSRTGMVYKIEMSTNLLDWKPIYTNRPGVSPWTFTDPGGTNTPRRFYRGRYEP